MTPELLRAYMQKTQLPPEDLVSEALAVLACHRYEQVPAPDSDAKR